MIKIIVTTFAKLGAAFVLVAVSLTNPKALAAPANILTVVKVTSLNDSGAGSLRECVGKTVPRLCVFEVSGRISLKDKLHVRQPDLYIAGQTAPSPGIVLTGAGIVVQASNVSVEHISVRVGDAPSGPPADERDNISAWGPGTTNVRFKNISASWSVDENFSTWDPVSDIRVDDSIISEALYNSIHPEGSHSMGALVGVGARRVTFSGNLFAANYDRNVRWRDNSEGAFLGNVVYGWGGTSSWNVTNVTGSPTAKPVKLDIIGNVYIPGPDGLRTPFVVYGDTVPLGSRIYISDTIAPKLTNLLSQFLSATRVVGTELPKQSASQTFESVLRNAGSRPWERNSIDERVIDGVRKGTLRIRNRVDEWPVVAVNSRKLRAPSDSMTLDQVATWLRSFESGPGTVSPPPPPPQATATPLPPDLRLPVATPTPTPQVPPANPTEVPTGNPTDVPAPFETPTRSFEPTIASPYAPATPTVTLEDRYPWLKSMRSWRRSARELCCTKRGRKTLKEVTSLAARPGIRRRCHVVACQ